ncbi:MAG: ATP-binding protein [Bacteroidales bacterium]|nr:ATP-binding protein [Bacteroidales bacterium]
MELTDLRPIVDFYHGKLAQVTLDFKRYLYPQINWDARVIGIKGERGVGKTTMLLQRIKEKYVNPDDTFYMSLDHYWFKTHTLQDLVTFLYNHGITEMYIDEVHKYKDWSSILKNLVDQYADLRIVYTGSSLLEIDNSKVDMSRRQTPYILKGMSFREYLQYEGILQMEAVPLEVLLSNHAAVAMNIISKTKVLKEFNKYMEHGVYPFYKESGSDFLVRLKEVVNTVIESDLPAVEKVTYETIEKCKKLFMIIAENVPLQPNVERLAQSLSTTRDTLLSILYNLDKAEVLALHTVELKSYKKLVNPAKIYLGNTNLMYAFTPKVEVGTLRETFFIDQLSAVSTVQMPTKGDFLIDGKYLFEVGGPSKDFEQIAGIKNSYIGADEIETGYGAIIPLWMFGLLY